MIVPSSTGPCRYAGDRRDHRHHPRTSLSASPTGAAGVDDDRRRKPASGALAVGPPPGFPPRAVPAGTRRAGCAQNRPISHRLVSVPAGSPPPSVTQVLLPLQHRPPPARHRYLIEHPPRRSGGRVILGTSLRLAECPPPLAVCYVPILCIKGRAARHVASCRAFCANSTMMSVFTGGTGTFIPHPERPTEARGPAAGPQAHDLPPSRAGINPSACV